jgi:cell division septal protein FtsQ
MLFHTKKKQKIKLRISDKKQKIKKFIKISFIILSILSSIILIIFVKNFIKTLFIEKNIFNIQIIKINIIESEKFKFKKNFKKLDFLKNTDIKVGNNLILLNPEKAGQDISRNFKNIETIKITKYYPKRIIVNIKLRQPLFFYKMSSKNGNERLFFIDKYGVFIPDKQNILELENFLIELEENTIFVSNFSENQKKYKINKEKIFLVSEFILYLQNNHFDFFRKIEKISMNDNFEITIFFKDKTFLTWGKYNGNNENYNYKEIDEKIKFFDLVMKDLKINKKNKEVHEINLQNMSINYDFEKNELEISDDSFIIVK